VSARHSGEAWTAEQDEVLREGCLALCQKLGRTWAGVKGRIERLSTYNWHVNWPENSPAPTAFQVLQNNEAAFLFLRQQIGVGKTVSMSDAAQEFQPCGIPRPHGVLIVEQLAKKGWVTIEKKGKVARTVTIHG
jgi:hypothetical protein